MGIRRGGDLSPGSQAARRDDLHIRVDLQQRKNCRCPIHYRHHDVRDHDPDVLRVAGEDRNSFRTVACGHGSVAVCFQGLLGDLPDSGFIIDHKDHLAVSRREVRCRALHGDVGDGSCRRNEDPERRPFPRFTVQVDEPLMALDDGKRG